MCSCIMNCQNISHINLWKHTVNGKFIIILTQRTCHIVFVIAWFILLTKDCNMMICTIHSRAHQVDCTCINTDIFLVGVFLMDGCCDQCHLSRNIAHPGQLATMKSGL